MEHSKPRDKYSHQLSLSGFKELSEAKPQDGNWQELRDHTIDNFAEEFKFAFNLSTEVAIKQINITFPKFISDDMRARFIVAMARKIDPGLQITFIDHMTEKLELKAKAREIIKAAGAKVASQNSEREGSFSSAAVGNQDVFSSNSSSSSASAASTTSTCPKGGGVGGGGGGGGSFNSP